MDNGRIVISYSRKDALFVKKLRKKLERLQFRTCQDVEDLRPGDDWKDSVDQALRDASVLLVVMSRNGRRSQFVSYEWAFALGAGLRVIPLLKEDVTLHPRLAGIQYVDFTKPGKTWLRLVDTLTTAPSWRSQNKEPGINATFDIENGNPKRVGREYVILLSMRDIPSTAQKVIYEVHDPSFKDPKWSKRNGNAKFSTWMSSYGDVLLTATISMPKRKLVASATLFEALNISHGKDKNTAIQTALKYIGEH